MNSISWPNVSQKGSRLSKRSEEFPMPSLGCSGFQLVMRNRISCRFLHFSTSVNINNLIKPSWWFQPIWKIWVKLDHFRKDRDESKESLKPLPSLLTMFSPFKSMCISGDLATLNDNKPNDSPTKTAIGIEEVASSPPDLGWCHYHDLTLFHCFPKKYFKTSRPFFAVLITTKYLS